MNRKCCVYSMYNCDRNLLYVGISVNPKSRMANHLCGKFWADEVSSIEIEWLDSESEARRLEEIKIKSLNPKYNKQLKLKKSTSLSLHFDDPCKKAFSDEMIKIIDSFPTRKDFLSEINNVDKWCGLEIKTEAVFAYVRKGDFARKMSRKYSISRRIAIFFHKKSELIQEMRPDVKDWYL